MVVPYSCPLSSIPVYGARLRVSETFGSMNEPVVVKDSSAPHVPVPVSCVPCCDKFIISTAPLKSPSQRPVKSTRFGPLASSQDVPVARATRSTTWENRIWGSESLGEASAKQARCGPRRAGSLGRRVERPQGTEYYEWRPQPPAA